MSVPTFTIDLTLVSPAQREQLLRREWFLTNGLGGFASGTVLGVPQRRYHNFLNGALRPPVGRVVGLSSVLETVVLKPGAASAVAKNTPVSEQRLEFSSFLFPGGGEGRAGEQASAAQVFAPGGYTHLERFEKDVTCRWFYRYGPVEFSRELALVRHENVGVLRYRVNAERHAARLELRPFTALRDFHELVKASERSNDYSVLAGSGGCEIACRGSRVQIAPGAASAPGSFVQDRQWWYNIRYARDAERGQDCLEDLFTPGVFMFELAPGRSHVIELVVSLDGEPLRSLKAPLKPVTRDEIAASESSRLDRLIATTTAGLGHHAFSEDEKSVVAVLVQSADQFVVRREKPVVAARPVVPGSPAARAGSSNADGHDCTVIAGYPWFSDWGRDTMISLPGLLLTTGRLDEATKVMEAFASLTRRGLVPNCFDNGSGAAEYNTVDASLWYLHAAANLHQACVAAGREDPTAENSPVRRACLAIIEAYQSGTDFNIRADAKDGLIAAGEVGTQLTWMDAKRDGVVFTPRHGKPVEINALWYSGLLVTADLCEKDRPRTSRELRQIGERVAKSFREQFWNEEDRCLFDVLAPKSGSFVAMDEIRPNQIFACSLPYSALDERQQQSVVKVVSEHLLTNRGLRTLSPTEKGYAARFEGPLFERDRAYHNGTVWPWLLGPYAEAVLRTGKFSARSRALARDAIQPLLDMIAPDVRPGDPLRAGGPAMGQIPEIYDADDSPTHPRRPDGCFAQAWSVAECLRVLALTLRS
ncbi:MAG: amylo-alpha-1,6-glucosidase [Phycisphaerales bacterium]|nr:amylo-alpha-1,6-glucosidase [Phycisphaerales bacterium]